MTPKRSKELEELKRIIIEYDETLRYRANGSSSGGSFKKGEYRYDPSLYLNIDNLANFILDKFEEKYGRIGA